MRLERLPSIRPFSEVNDTVRIYLLIFFFSSSVYTFGIQFQQGFHPIFPYFRPQTPSRLNYVSRHAFTLRHVFDHGDLNRATIQRRFDVITPEDGVWIESEPGNRYAERRILGIKSKQIVVERLRERRPSFIDSMVAMGREFPQIWSSSHDAWTLDALDAPDITDPETILTLAHMSANAYLENPDSKDWNNIHGDFNSNQTNGFGWNSDGLRGYLYADESNSTVVISIKGTTMAIWDGDGTTTNDKENDNLFFSCCCGQQGNSFYREVCDCATSKYTCNLTCLRGKMREENRYYAAGRQLYHSVTTLYPNASVWLTGHSLGGSVSSMLGLTYGSPAVTFQAIPDALPVNRLQLPVPPAADPERPGQRNNTGVFHFGHTADPIYMGACNGPTASCSYAGYALESACHTGQECVWDVVENNGTRLSVLTHRINYVIDHIMKKWNTIPKCHLTPDCYDCSLWKEVTLNSTTSSTFSSSAPTSTSTKARTRTSTCETPGWWGCLDESTTIEASSTNSLSAETATMETTCNTPGACGFQDEITSTGAPVITILETVIITITTTMCDTSGRFGYEDKTIGSDIISSSAITETLENYNNRGGNLSYHPSPMNRDPEMVN